jgi:hypothetical protein
MTTPPIAKITTSLAALAATAAIGAPPALALGPQQQGAPGVQPTAPSNSTTNHPLLTPPNVPSVAETPTMPRPAVASDSAGFDWSAAAIGALVAAGACLVLVGLALDIRRRHEPKAV